MKIYNNLETSKSCNLTKYLIYYICLQVFKFYTICSISTQYIKKIKNISQPYIEEQNNWFYNHWFIMFKDSG